MDALLEIEETTTEAKGLVTVRAWRTPRHSTFDTVARTSWFDHLRHANLSKASRREASDHAQGSLCWAVRPHSTFDTVARALRHAGLGHEGLSMTLWNGATVWGLSLIHI